MRCIHIHIYIQRYEYTYIYIYVLVYIYIYICTPHVSGLSCTLLREIPGPGGVVFYVGGLFIDKPVRGSPCGDGPQQAGLNTAIESKCEAVVAWPAACQESASANEALTKASSFADSIVISIRMWVHPVDQL